MFRQHKDRRIDGQQEKYRRKNVISLRVAPINFTNPSDKLNHKVGICYIDLCMVLIVILSQYLFFLFDNEIFIVYWIKVTAKCFLWLLLWKKYDIFHNNILSGIYTKVHTVYGDIQNQTNANNSNFILYNSENCMWSWDAECRCQMEICNLSMDSLGQIKNIHDEKQQQTIYIYYHNRARESILSRKMLLGMN